MSKDPFDLASGVPADVGAPVEGAIQPKPKTSIGMNKAVVLILMLVLVLVMFIFFASLEKVDEKNSGSPEKKQKEVKEAPVSSKVPRDILEARPDFTELLAKKEKEKEAKEALEGVAAKDSKKPVSGEGEGKPALPDKEHKVPAVPTDQAVPAQQKVLTPEEQRKLAIIEAREQRMMAAKTDGLGITGFPKDGVMAGARSAGGAMPGGSPIGSNNAGPAASKWGSNSNAKKFGNGDQDQKNKFMSDAAERDVDNHKHSVKAKTSDYELKAGTFIPAVLEMAINSDMPGLVTARVRENVFDSVTGAYLLIPSASKLIGSYDSRVALGQSRQLVVWNQIIFPDGSHLNLAGMSSTSMDGQSGLESEVDNHYFRLFGVTLGISLVTAGVQMATPDPPAVSSNTLVPALTNQQILSMQLAQQYGRLGAQVLGKYLQVQPTLRNHPGERFNLIVPRNIVFPGAWGSGVWGAGALRQHPR